jgi:hypothetical protein
MAEDLIRLLATWWGRKADLRRRRGERSASHWRGLTKFLELLFEIPDAILLFLGVLHLLLVHARDVIVLVV